MPYKDKEKKGEHDREYSQRPEVKKRRKKRGKEWREAHPDYDKIYHQKHKEKRGEASKKWQEENKERVKKIHKKASKRYRKKYPKRIKAIRKANRYIKIPKGQLCEICNKKLATEKHHPDYNKPLEVKFLCHNCHCVLSNRPHRNL